MRFQLFALLFALPSLAFSQNYSGPESVEGDTLTGNYYVGNTGSEQILRRLPSGDLETFATGISNGPYGLELVDGVLYACNGGEVRGFSLADGSQVFSVQTDASFLNGITHVGSDFLYATDFSGKKIYKIDIAMQASEVFVAQTISTPNGIVYDLANDRLVFVSWGSSAKIVAVSLTDASLTTLVTTNLSNIDGVAMDGAGNYYVASWGANAVHRFELTFTEAPEMVMSGLNKPADIYYNLKTDTLAVPNSGDNTVSFAFFGEEPPSFVGAELVDFQLKVFPNPTSQTLTVTTGQIDGFQTASFQICTMDGVLMPAIQSKLNNQQVEFEMAQFPKGSYLLKVSRNDNFDVVQFMKN
ncbi:MAG: T9SS type A sorting domain-containing protein [Saprospiraceae bacterium]|nr:T9SS type A sorting domain-containing protein [Saprospiraceae bacterium]MCF8248605.1 T9SS type A sorting domain-containing protein [Saprospiraceae bacterium]MCF8281043.1 T9SS type A sorting domain-containing protein [Bacteroidales bacterium]MCF8310338.1 T9SS type A sorting domain-containing protein [Saprospiraceae bacterium]MCF8442081.1 T9SS type A sorting domain-containing protein [Saprospiraceae bacterium]